MKIVSTILLFQLLSSNTLKAREAVSTNPLIGYWVLENDPSMLKIFEKTGKFFNLIFEEGKTFFSHTGRFQIKDKTHYVENITDARTDATYDLKSRKYIIKYEVSADGQKLTISGLTDGKHGIPALKWTEVYIKVGVLK